MFRNTDIWMKHICCLHSHNHLTSQKTRSISLSSSDCDRSLDFSQLKSIPEAAFLSLCRTDLCTGPCTGSHIAGEMFVKIGRKSEGLGQVLGFFFLHFDAGVKQESGHRTWDRILSKFNFYFLNFSKHINYIVIMLPLQNMQIAKESEELPNAFISPKLSLFKL